MARRLLIPSPRKKRGGEDAFGVRRRGGVDKHHRESSQKDLRTILSTSLTVVPEGGATWQLPDESVESNLKRRPRGCAAIFIGKKNKHPQQAKIETSRGGVLSVAVSVDTRASSP